MKKYIVLLVICLTAVLTLAACNVKSTQNTEDEPGMKNNKNDTSEVSGGKVDNSYNAPTKIESKNIESFKTYFYLWDQYDEASEGSYSFAIDKNDGGEYILSEDAHCNISVTIDKSVLNSLQKIIDDNSLILNNGMDEHTEGLPVEFAPCMFSATYDSGEQLYFSMDNDPEAKWAKDVKELFKEEFIRQGHDELLPPVEDTTLIRFDMEYKDENVSIGYTTIFTEEDTEDISYHYLTGVYSADTGECISEVIQTIPDNFYEDLSALLTDLRLQTYQNEEISSLNNSQDEKYASFCMEMQSGAQINAYYSGEEAEELTKALETVKEYIDGQLAE